MHSCVYFFAVYFSTNHEKKLLCAIMCAGLLMELYRLGHMPMCAQVQEPGVEVHRGEV